MRTRTALLLLSCIACAVCMNPRPSRAAGLELPDTVPGRRFAEVLARINAGDRDSIAAYARATFVPDMLTPDVDSIVDFLLAQYRVNGGYDARRVLESTAGQIAVLVQGRRAKDRWMRFVLGAEPDPPQRVQGIFLFKAAAAMAEEERGPVAEAELPSRFEKIVGAMAAEGRFSGAVCLTRAGSTLVDRAWGMADREAGVPNRPDTRFGIASVGKTFTAVAIGQLLEQGKIALDDPVRRYVPRWVSPAARAVTIRELLSHTSGLGDYLDTLLADRTGRRYDRIEDYRAIAAADTPAFEPGTGFRYSNVGYLVLGAVVQAVSGEPWDRYLAERVFAPAGMRSTSAYRPATPGAVATGYLETPGGGWARNDTLLDGRGTPAGGNASTARDLAAFANALLAGRLISPAMLDSLTAPRADLTGTGLMYGRGFTVSRGPAGSRVWGHAGGFPGVGALLEVYEAGGWVLAVTSNTTDGASPVADVWRDLLRRSRSNASGAGGAATGRAPR